jgi:hypothetical protein
MGSLVVMLMALPPLSAAEPPGPEALLGRIKAVGKEGKGNADAARAWQELVKLGPEVLPQVLGAMDDATPTASNWLRLAASALGEKAMQAELPLPVRELEAFLGQTAHTPPARRIAYEWLVKADRTAAGRWLPKLLQDPSHELRREAVQRLVDETDHLADGPRQLAGHVTGGRVVAVPSAPLLRPALKEAAIANYRKALGGATDQDQVDHIAAELKLLGVNIDLAAHFGFVRNWHLATPFDNSAMSGFTVAYPPEKGVDLKAVYKGKDGKEARWMRYSTTNEYGKVDLNQVLGKLKGTIGYAHAIIESDREQPVEVRAGSFNALKFFLNGKEIFNRDEYHHGMFLDQHIGRGTLKAGRNELLIKVCQNEQTENWAQSWSFQVRLCDGAGAAVPFRNPPAAGKEPGR